MTGTWIFGSELSGLFDGSRFEFFQHPVADVEEFVLTRPEPVDETGAALRVLPAVEGVEFGGHRRQVLVGVKEPRHVRLVRPLGSIQKLTNVIHDQLLIVLITLTVQGLLIFVGGVFVNCPQGHGIALLFLLARYLLTLALLLARGADFFKGQRSLSPCTKIRSQRSKATTTLTPECDSSPSFSLLFQKVKQIKCSPLTAIKHLCID